MSKRFFPFTVIEPGTDAALLRAGAEVPIEQQLADAFNANNAVLAYVNGLGRTAVEELKLTEPAWYTKFRQQFKDAKAHAMRWDRVIVPQLLKIPKGIADYALTWNQTMDSIDVALGVLATKPQSTQAKQVVIDGLTRLLGGLEGFKADVVQFETHIRTFAADVAADAVILQQASIDAKKEAGYNRAQVEALAQHVKELQEEVKTWQVVHTAAIIATAVIAVVATVLVFFTAGLSIGIAVVAALAAAATAIAADVKITQLSGQIAQDQAGMSDLNKQIASFDILVTALNELVVLAGAAGEQIKLVLTAWKTLETELATVITDLTKAKGDATNVNFVALHADLQAAKADWAKLRDFCLKIAAVKYVESTPPAVQLPTSRVA